MSAVKRKKSLAEQIASLSTPKPVSYHPDHEFLEDDTAVKVCDFSYDLEEEGRELERRIKGARRRFGDLEEDPKYAGRVVSRKELERQDSSSEEEEEEEEGEKWVWLWVEHSVFDATVTDFRSLLSLNFSCCHMQPIS